MKKPDIIVALDMVIGYWASSLNLSDLLNRSFDDASMIEST